MRPDGQSKGVPEDDPDSATLNGDDWRSPAQGVFNTVTFRGPLLQKSRLGYYSGTKFQAFDGRRLPKNSTSLTLYFKHFFVTFAVILRYTYMPEQSVSHIVVLGLQ